MKNQVQLFFASMTLLATCIVLWSVARPLVDATTPIWVVGFNLSLPALLTGASILIGFAALCLMLYAGDNFIAAWRGYTSAAQMRTLPKQMAIRH